MHAEEELGALLSSDADASQGFADRSLHDSSDKIKSAEVLCRDASASRHLSIYRNHLRECSLAHNEFHTILMVTSGPQNSARSYRLTI